MLENDSSGNCVVSGLKISAGSTLSCDRKVIIMHCLRKILLLISPNDLETKNLA